MRERRRWKRSDRYSKVVEETLKQCSSEVVERKKRESGGDLSGCVGTLKFLCEIFSITPYLSLAGAPPFYWLPLGPRLSCWLVALLAPLPAQLLAAAFACGLRCALLKSTLLLPLCFCACRSCSCVKS